MHEVPLLRRFQQSRFAVWFSFKRIETLYAITKVERKQTRANDMQQMPPSKANANKKQCKKIRQKIPCDNNAKTNKMFLALIQFHYYIVLLIACIHTERFRFTFDVDILNICRIQTKHSSNK